MTTGFSSDLAGARSLLHEPGHVFVAAWKNVVVFVWSGDATVELMRKLGPIFETLTRDVGRISVISIVTRVLALPDDRKRQAYREFLEAHGPKMAHMAMVLEREGFVGSAVRGLVTGLLLLTSQRYAVHVTGTLDDVVTWLPPKHAVSTGIELDPTELLQAITQARAFAVRGAARSSE